MPSRLVAARKERAPAKTVANRHVAVRLASDRAIRSRVIATGHVHSASVHDIVLGGIALHVNGPLKPGTLILIEFHNPQLKLTYDLAASVVHATRCHHGEWIFGCAFMRELTQLELNSLM